MSTTINQTNSQILKTLENQFKIKLTNKVKVNSKGDIIDLDLSCTNITTLENLGKLTSLKTLLINEAYELKNLNGLDKIKSLEEVFAYNLDISKKEVSNIMDSLPNLKFIVFE